MDTAVTLEVVNQHLIDPEICIRCNTCEATCPKGAITHDSRNYVVDPAKCEMCLACVPPCPTGSIDNWRMVAPAQAYSVEEQLGWDSLPPELTPPQREMHNIPSTAAAMVDATVMEEEAHQPFQEVPDDWNARVDAFWREVDRRDAPLSRPQ